MPAISDTLTWRQEEPEFEASPSKLARSCLKNKIKKSWEHTSSTRPWVQSPVWEKENI
jgi:hypothetical protein